MGAEAAAAEVIAAPHVVRLRGMTAWLQLRAKSQFTDAANFTLRCVGGGKDVGCGGGTHGSC